MNKKAWLSGLALAAAVGGFSTSSVAGVNAQIAINVGPPPMRQELRPTPRRGMVWTPGFWNWQGNRHVWVQGHWVRERVGYRWVEPNWVSHNGRWILVQGYWANGRVGPRGDRDHDGVRNRNDRDRDGDGVPNRRDRHPDNPRRQ
ncbi:MAG: hypothetical protein ABI564_08830 [Ideonella sp.]